LTGDKASFPEQHMRHRVGEQEAAREVSGEEVPGCGGARLAGSRRTAARAADDRSLSASSSGSTERHISPLTPRYPDEGAAVAWWCGCAASRAVACRGHTDYIRSPGARPLLQGYNRFDGGSPTSSDWNKWKVAIQAEIASLYERKVFSAVMPTPPGILPVGYKWVFIHKRNEDNAVVRYKSKAGGTKFYAKTWH